MPWNTFFDNDPGISNGNAIANTPADTTNDVFDVSTAGLEIGLHNIFFRFKDSNGTWSIYEGGAFFINEIGEISGGVSGKSYGYSVRCIKN